MASPDFVVIMMSQLLLSNLSKRFGDFQALKDVSLAIESGEFVCLLGASGCGKTTLLRLIAGLEAPDTGSITSHDRELSSVPCHKRNIGMVFQTLALFPHLDVGGNIGYGLSLRGETKTRLDEKVTALLDLVGMSGLERRAVTALSGGQRQRVAIARALAIEPDIFLMDEPFSALDAALREQMQVEVKHLQRKLGVTTIFVTHDQREAMTLADRIVVLNEGRIEQVGTPGELYHQPDTRFVADFIGTNNLLDVEVGMGVTFKGQTLRTPHALGQGACTLAIRPENIRLGGLAAEGLQGVVANVRHLGALLESEIDVSGTTIHHTAFSSGDGDISVGDRVTIDWDWDKVRVLPQ